MTPTLSRIVVYPIKSLDGVTVSHSRVLPSGALLHDRRFVSCDAAGQVINGKRTVAVHKLRLRELAAACGQPNVPAWLDAMVMESPGNGASPRSRTDQPTPSPSPESVAQPRGEGPDEEPFRFLAAAEAWLSARLAMPVRLIENPLAGFPDDTAAPGPTVISLATLAEVALWFPGLSIDDVRARFRANLEIDGVEPFWEDRLYAEAGEAVRFQIGHVSFDGLNPCQRCVVPTRSATTGEVWPEFAKTFARRREATLPGWAARRRFDHFYRLAVNTRLHAACKDGGMISVGDQVCIA